jgi:hypothetical protein
MAAEPISGLRRLAVKLNFEAGSQPEIVGHRNPRHRRGTYRARSERRAGAAPAEEM